MKAVSPTTSEMAAVALPFRTQARTIDHLGQNQIADCPTAVSELWKNAYDAYAKEVALHVFDTKPPMAAVVDSGHGMSPQEFTDRWLVVGTQSKAGDQETPEEDRLGLGYRVPQGQKGIGRLSVAYLGPLVLVISKRKGHRFVASLIDWRIFENPYLLLEDVLVPVETFEKKDEFAAAFERMRNLISENVWPTRGDVKRLARLKHGWERYDKELENSKGKRLSDEIAESVIAFEVLTEERLRVWPTWCAEDVDSACGTALYILDVRRELGVWVDVDASREDDEVKESQKLLEDTLICYVDPYDKFQRDNFRYEVVIHKGGTQKRPIRWEDTISLSDVFELEHVVDGEVDEAGVFRGRIKAFGEDKGPIVLPPRRSYPESGSGRVGSFRILLATYEVNVFSSSLTPELHALWEQRAERYGGLAIYRDGLRVLPYGRTTGDMFDIDYRRSKHAGRYFWAYRRTIGRISLQRAENSNLVDKAGREGLKDNQARREFRLRVIDILNTTAQRYFGTDSPERGEKIAANEEHYRATVKAAGKRSLRKLRAELRSKVPQLDAALDEAERTLLEVRSAVAEDPGTIPHYEERLEHLKRRRNDLAIGPPPRGLAEEDEHTYRAYRDRYRDLKVVVDELFDAWASGVERVRSADPVAVATRKHAEHEDALRRHLLSWQGKIREILKGELSRIDEEVAVDRARFEQCTNELLVELSHGRMTLSSILSRMEVERETLYQSFAERYEAYLGTLERLHEGTDVEGALRWSSGEIDALREKVRNVQALAQLGITVEIIGHEFEDLDAEIRRGLGRLPRDAQATEAFQIAKRAHFSLANKLRFLTPLKLSGQRLSEEIRGTQIADYLRKFFGERITEGRVDLKVTEAFKTFGIVDLRSRIYPVFINLLSNALYWVTFAKQERIILLDRVDDLVVVSDSGPGVDPDDVSRLFELFFTRRVDGRGVGLYLCRENLGAANHKIDYADTAEHTLLGGANFVIRFKGIKA